jgi:hypothetical protein
MWYPEIHRWQLFQKLQAYARGVRLHRRFPLQMSVQHAGSAFQSDFSRIPSVIGLNPAIRDRVKSGHREALPHFW